MAEFPLDRDFLRPQVARDSLSAELRAVVQQTMNSPASPYGCDPAWGRTASPISG